LGILSYLTTSTRIRYAAPPVGKLRWQAPQAPPVNLTSIQWAMKQPPRCPQSGGAKLPKIYGFNSALGDEDCLFLNVYAPPGAKNLPVLLWIRKSMLNQMLISCVLKATVAKFLQMAVGTAFSGPPMTQVSGLRQTKTASLRS